MFNTILQGLGTFAKGRATYTGLAVTLLGVLGQTGAAQDIAAWSDVAGQVVMGLGTVLTSFGIGRKAGVVGAPTIEARQRMRGI